MQNMQAHGAGSALKARAAATLMTLAALLALALAGLALPTPAQADESRMVDSVIFVADDITRIHVDKVDAGTHEFVPNAKMAIVVKDTGEVVEEWTTSRETHKVEKSLNVNTTYLLREVYAPEGYARVADIEFQVNEIEGEGITLLNKPENVEQTGSYKVTLYEQHDDFVVEKVDERVSTSSSTSSSSSASEDAGKTVAPKTGDETPLAAGIAVAILGILGIAVLQVAKLRIRRG